MPCSTTRAWRSFSLPSDSAAQCWIRVVFVGAAGAQIHRRSNSVNPTPTVAPGTPGFENLPGSYGDIMPTGGFPTPPPRGSPLRGHEGGQTFRNSEPRLAWRPATGRDGCHARSTGPCTCRELASVTKPRQRAPSRVPFSPPIGSVNRPSHQSCSKLRTVLVPHVEVEVRPDLPAG